MIFKLVGEGVCQRRLKKYKKIADAMEYREALPKKKLNESFSISLRIFNRL